ncbi:MAG: hypothetical protein FJX80_04595 [Bacteroidetes bacterium]|nr:hypothetical protein [Bacteroidota bacterium]
MKLIIFGLFIQIVSLFRNYPLDHPCGRVLDINSVMRVLINCDSSVYMKDAQNPIRLVNGESVYQDRPIPTLLVAMLAKFWHFLNLPDYYREVQGNSGQIVTYSLVTYIIFLALSAAIFSTACYIGLKSLFMFQQKLNIHNEIFINTAFIFVVVVAMNEITKTFFWTPGSQMFNLLLPVYAFYLITYNYKDITYKFYFSQILIVSLLFFSYAFFIILLVPLVLANWNKLRNRILLCSVPIIAYLSYPFLLNQFGGTYNNFAVGYRRMYIWVIDAYKQDKAFEKISEFLGYFLESIPLMPTILILFALTTFKLMKKNINLDFRSEIFLISVHILMISFYGYYSRRLTFPIIVLLFLVAIKLFFSLKSSDQKRILQLGLPVLVPLVMGSWIFTLGPLV